MPAKDVTFTATWEEDRNQDGIPDEDQVLTIVFDAGEGSFKDDASYTYTLIPGDAYPTAPGAEKLNAPEGKAFDSWDPTYDLTGTVPEGQKTETKNYTAQYGEDSNGDGTPDDKEEKYTITYEAGAEDESIAGIPEAVRNVLKNTEQTVSKEVPTRTDYVFTGWTSDEVIVENGMFTMPAKDVTFTATWEEDRNQDGTPDEDQYVNLTFISEYGFVNETGNKVVLEKQVPNLKFEAPTPLDTENDNVVFVGWDNDLANDGKGIVPEVPTTYTAQYKDDVNNNGKPDVDESYDLTITYAYAEGEEGEATLPETHTETDLAVGEAYSVPSPAVEGYVAEPEVVEGTIVDQDVNVDVVYHRDTNGNGEPDVDESYDLTITYAYAEGEEGEATLPETHTETDLAVGEAYSVPSPAVEGYVAEPEVVEGTIVDRDVNVEVVYHRDSNGNG